MGVLLQKTEVWTRTLIRRISGRDIQLSRVVLSTIALAAVLFLALYNLSDYPLTWFDEGSHLHVPKALVKYGVYADYSSEGFRYYGPTNGVGPTLLLPIAGVFELFGIGLLQARLVVVVYLIAALYLFYRLADHLGGKWLAWVAIALLVASRGVAILEYGRQVLGEVPAFAFLLAGLLVWWQSWEKRDWMRILLAGVLLGLSVVTKTQFLLFLAPTLLLAWFANLFYYRLLPQRVFIVPGLITGGLFAIWQAILLLAIDPQGNLALLTKTSGSAAFVFSMDLIRRSFGELLSIRGYFGLAGLALLFGVSLILPKRIVNFKWGILWMLAVINLGWYLFASVSWLRYAFAGLAVSCLFLARIFVDLVGGFRHRFGEVWKSIWRSGVIEPMDALRATLLIVILALGTISLALNVRGVVAPPANPPFQMAAYLNENVPVDEVIETYEPEMGFLTDHRFHFPPHSYLNQTIQSIWMGGASPGVDYKFITEEKPGYILVGEFATWVNFYSMSDIEANYTKVTVIGPYRLYRSNSRE